MKHDYEPKHQPEAWSVEGILQHLIYSPKGGIEGVMLDAGGVPTQFVFDHGQDEESAFHMVMPGQRLTLEGVEAKPWPAGENAHAVYQFKRLVDVDGKPSHDAGKPAAVEGRVVRFNYARHGEANGVVLDSGDFIHVRPDRFARLRLAIGDSVRASGQSRALADKVGRVIEAVDINGQPVDA